MHDKMQRPRKRGRRFGGHPEDWLTLPQQRAKALDLIDPAPEERAECETEIPIMIRMVQDAKAAVDRHTLSRKRDLNRAIKKLHAVEVVLCSLSPDLTDAYEWLLDQLKWERQFLGKLVADETIRRGGSQQNPAKRTAALHSWMLLSLFSPRPVTLTEDGTWHQLAATLFGYTTVDLFDFDYLRLVRRQIRDAANSPKTLPKPSRTYTSRV